MSNNDFKTRLKIAKKKSKYKSNTDNKQPRGSYLGQAFKMSTELVSAVVVGTIIGFILFFFVGVIAGIMNVIKSAKRLQDK